MRDETRFPFQRLDAYKIAREIAQRVHHAGIRDPELNDQAGRASKSVFLNVCEGLPDDRVRVRARFFTDADNSLHETVGAVDLAVGLGLIAADDASEIFALSARLRRILRGLRNPRPPGEAGTRAVGAPGGAGSGGEAEATGERASSRYPVDGSTG